MKAAWYERQGPAPDVLNIGELPTPNAGEGEIRIRVLASGINPGDVKKRQDSFGVGMPYPRVIPHSDGAGVVDQVGQGVSSDRIGERVWCFGAQSYRAFGTAAAWVVVPAEQAIPLPESVSMEQGACLGIPGLTAHRAVHSGGRVSGRTVLIQGGAGAVGQCAVALAGHAGARVLATVRSEQQGQTASHAGADAIIRTDGRETLAVVDEIRSHAPDGVDHIVEVAFDANIRIDEQVLGLRGSIAAYATGAPEPSIPFWPLLFKNARLFLLGSDDFQSSEKQAAARDLNEALVSGWSGFSISDRLPLEEVAEAHLRIESRGAKGRVVLELDTE
ncbi:MAG: NADPH2:quinone reductase [Rhodothermales bacterium]|jgi:NADPH2:quinone reductase